jgi:hypothetical protein
MRIDNGYLAGTQASQANRAAESQELEQAGRQRADATGAAGSDRVELSALAHRIAGVLEAAEARQAGRVRELARAYQSGRYEPQPHEVSRAVVAEALENGRGPHRQE